MAPARSSDSAKRARVGEAVTPFPRSLSALRQAAAGCERCPLYRDATQTVFGEGPSDAPVVLIGEVPGDLEDIAGKPFVGPAGRILDRALAEASIDRARVYVTNAVKHFKFELRGKRRLHKKPTASEIDRCRWWLDRELELIAPQLAVALGVTAARGLFGRPVTISSLRGEFVALRAGMEAFVTVHPSSVLRQPDEAARQREYQKFVRDMRAVARHVPAVGR